MHRIEDFLHCLGSVCFVRLFIVIVFTTKTSSYNVNGGRPESKPLVWSFHQVPSLICPISPRVSKGVSFWTSRHGIGTALELISMGLSRARRPGPRLGKATRVDEGIVESFLDDRLSRRLISSTVTRVYHPLMGCNNMWSDCA